MRATVMYGTRDVRVTDLPDATLVEPTDVDADAGLSRIRGRRRGSAEPPGVRKTKEARGLAAIGMVQSPFGAPAHFQIGCAGRPVRSSGCKSHTVKV